MPIMDESDVSLPKATLSKMIRELMPGDLRFGSESLDMLIECCTEFVSLLSTESNDVSINEKKNTIHPEHVMKALEDLGFGEFVPEVKETWNSWKEENKNKSTALRPRGHKTAADAAGYSEEQQIAIQQRLFADAKARSNSFQEVHATSALMEERSLTESMSPESFSRPSPFNSATLSAELHSATGATVPSSMYTELSARADILPIQPLPASPIASEFRPTVISSAMHPMDSSENETTTEGEPSAVQQILDFRHISMSQPVIILHNGVQHLVSWQTVLSQVAMLPQFSHQQMENSAPVEFSLQMPVVSAHASVMQPSFPESIPITALAANGQASMQFPAQSQEAMAVDPLSSEARNGLAPEAPANHGQGND